MTIARRDLVIGAACVAGSLAAFGLTPRRHVSLMAAGRLGLMTPAAFATWTSRDVTDLVAPKTANSLADRLYNSTVERIYIDATTGSQVMVLLAHGDTQSNELQLHRPEVCYPAFGFEISASQRCLLPIISGAMLPARSLVAEAPGRRENIVYWTRLGEFLPTTENEQRLDRVKTALHGVIADGLLARFSLVSDDTQAALTTLRGFVGDFVKSLDPANRAAFVGTRLSLAMAGVRS
jgi:EpsI family protein